jgi:hypothetical protein
MPSDAFLAWQTERMMRLDRIEADCVHLETLHSNDLQRVQEFIRSYAVLLSAEFQGFCRNLNDECADKFVASISPLALQDMLRSQCVWGRKLDTGNANPGNLGSDFNRFQFNFWSEVLDLDPLHEMRRNRLETFNTWRNAIAHHNYDPTRLGGTTTLTILQVQEWRGDCNALASAFDAVTHKHLLSTTGVPPWPP